MYVDGPFDSEEEDSKTGDETKRKHQGKSKSTRKPECLKSNTIIQTHADIIRVSKVKPKKFVVNVIVIEDAASHKEAERLRRVVRAA